MAACDWKVPHYYAVGEHARWHGVELVCTRAHYAGEAAKHPWDPGDGWDIAKAATLWTPCGTSATYALLGRAQFEIERLREVMVTAARV